MRIWHAFFDRIGERTFFCKPISFFDLVIMLSTNQKNIKIGDACEMGLIKDLRGFFPFLLCPFVIMTSVLWNRCKNEMFEKPFAKQERIHANRTHTLCSSIEHLLMVCQ